MGLRDEIHEQPEMLRRLADDQWPSVSRVAEAIRQRDIEYIFLAARGTSDNAGLYAKYLWGAHNQIPVALAAPSLFSLYGMPPRLRGALVLAISQSGQSPDIVGVVADGRRQGALTVAFTNDVLSPLGQTAEYVIDIGAGAETAVAATKSYTAQLMSIALLSVALNTDHSDLAVLRRVPEWVEEVLRTESDVQRVAERYRYMEQCVVLGRGFNYSTAYEWALKIKELAYVMAAPYSSADFRHGPIAMVARGFPVLAVAPKGAVYDDLLMLIRMLKDEHRVELLVVSDGEEALSLADRTITLPDGVPEWLSPIVAIVAGQLYAYYLTRAKGYDTEAPMGLSKVTKTV